MKKIINTEKAPDPIGPYSQAVVVGNMLFASGQVAIKPSDGSVEMTNIVLEATQVMENIGAILKEAAYEFKDIVKTTIFLKDMNDFQTVNEIYGKYFSGNYPARETVQVSALPKNVNVEISVTAVKE